MERYQDAESRLVTCKTEWDPTIRRWHVSIGVHGRQPSEDEVAQLLANAPVDAG
jgi:hypothetical protein